MSGWWSMHGWMHGWMMDDDGNERCMMDEIIGVWMDGRWRSRWMWWMKEERRDGWIDGQTDGWMDGWIWSAIDGRWYKGGWWLGGWSDDLTFISTRIISFFEKKTSIIPEPNNTSHPDIVGQTLIQKKKKKPQSVEVTPAFYNLSIAILWLWYFSMLSSSWLLCSIKASVTACTSHSSTQDLQPVCGLTLVQRAGSSVIHRPLFVTMSAVSPSRWLHCQIASFLLFDSPIGGPNISVAVLGCKQDPRTEYAKFHFSVRKRSNNNYTTQKHCFRREHESLEWGKVKYLSFPGSGSFQAEGSLLLGSAELKGFNLSLSFIVFVWLIIPPTICLRRRITADSAKRPEFLRRVWVRKSLNSRGLFFFF